MSGTTDYIKVLGRVQTGPGNLFIGPKNSIITDYTDRTTLTHVGYCKNGEEINSLGEDFSHDGGAPLRTNKMEVTKQGITITFNIAEPSPTTTGIIGYGQGVTSTVNEDATEAFSLQQVYLYGNNIAKLPYHHISVTEIRSSDPTPSIYTGSAITDNFEINTVRGTIKAKEGGSVTPEDIDGSLFYVTGTWSKPLENILKIGSLDTYEKDYYSVFYLPDIAEGNTNGIFIPKASISEYGTRTYRVGEDRLDTLTFKSIKAPNMAYEWMEVEEVA